MDTPEIISSVSLFFSMTFGIYTLYIGRKLNKQQIQINEHILSQNKKMKKTRRKHLYVQMPLKQKMEVGE